MHGGGRAGNLEIVLEEMDAVRRALDRSRPGDLVVLCVDDATEVWKELEARRTRGRPLAERAAEGDGAGASAVEVGLSDLEIGL